MLILTSEFAHVADKLAHAWYLNGMKKVAFVQNATDSRQDAGEIISWVESAKDRYCDNGYHLDILDLRVAQGEKLYTTLQQYDCLHIHGGDNEYLHHVCKEASLFDCVHSLVQNGLIYIGSSAWSLMAWPDLSYAILSQENVTIWGKHDFTWFWLHPFYLVPHAWKSERKQKVMERIDYCEDHHLCPFLTLSDTQALVYEDGKYILVG